MLSEQIFYKYTFMHVQVQCVSYQTTHKKIKSGSKVRAYQGGVSEVIGP